MLKRILIAALLCATSVQARETDFPILFTNVNVFDGVSEALIENANVLVVDNLIAEVSSEPLAAANAQIIDGGGRTLMPGIIEGHNHVAVPVSFDRFIADEDMVYIGARATISLSFFIDHGITTVRDAGGPSAGLQKAVEEGYIVGPRIYSSGMFISQTSGHGDFRRLYDSHPNDLVLKPQVNRVLSHIADGVPEVQRAVREELRKGAVHIKVMAGGGQSSVFDPLHTVQYSLEELNAAVEAAADWDTYVMVHAYADEAVLRSIEAGVKVIEHGHLISEETAKVMAENDVWLSTQANFADPSKEAEDMLLEQFGPDTVEKFVQVRDGFAAAAGFAKKYGLKIAWGTDSWGDNLSRLPLEWGFRANYFSNYEQLVQATSQNAELLRLTGKLNPYPEGPLGVIEVGAYADIILVDGDPLSDILVMQERDNIDLVMKNGNILKNTLN